MDSFSTGRTGKPSSRAASLARELESKIHGEVRFDDGSRGLYSTDGSNYRQVPVGVVIPRTVDDVRIAVQIAQGYEVPILGRGCGTSLAGQCCNAALVIDTSKYLNRVIEIDPERRLARVEPGAILDDLRKAAKPYGLTFGPDPATHDHCTLGGMIGNNSCGIHSVQAEFYGPGARTEDNVEELDILTYDGLRLQVGPTTPQELESYVAAGGRRGEIYRGLKMLAQSYGPGIRARFPKIPRRVSGYNLPQLLEENGFNLAKALVGTESTCAMTLEATVKLVPEPKARALLVLGYPSVYEAGDHIPDVREHKPIGLEGIDDVLIEYMKKKHLHPGDAALLPEGGGWLLVEFGGDTRSEARDRARESMERLKRGANGVHMAVHDDPAKVAKLWEIRESGLGATAFVPEEPDSWPGWEDSAEPPEKVGAYLRDLRKLFQRYDYHCSLYGHFGQGCIHTRIDFNLRSREGIRKFRRFTSEAAELVVGHGGSLSGEHGDGQARGDLLRFMFGGEILQAFREFKSAWDPQWKMNPGKIVDADPRARNLRLHETHPASPVTHFQYPEDGSFAHAALRCVGVGKCRRMEGGTMCPSFMATREEKHSTRGRARLLFEMLHGDPVTGGWKDKAVKEALDLCLACKGCKSDCPVNVDMATYKAEFLSHYYEGRLRPRAAYAFGLIHRWARLASWAPGLANFFTQTRGLSAVAKRLVQVAPARKIPAFASETFQQRHHGADIGTTGPRKPEVVLWPDTFNNYFHPETAEAALQVLRAAGYQVTIPQGPVCCGRPLYDYGMLDTAKKRLCQTLEVLRPALRTGTPVVVLEPSCAAVFQDELTNLLPDHEDAKRLRRSTFLFGEFLQKHPHDFSPELLSGKALFHGHCHQKALSGTDSDQTLLARLGLDVTAPDSGCCGMAGSFGFERGSRFEVSMVVGERLLLPAVRAASKDTLIVADGFSCREQIRQTTDREALHSAQVLQMALQTTPVNTTLGSYPESAVIAKRTIARARSRRQTTWFLGAAALAAALWIAFVRVNFVNGKECP